MPRLPQLLLVSLMVWVQPGDAVAGFIQCSDQLDNNASGLIDMEDPYCRSPEDDDESSFASGIAGDDTNSPSQLDCWFDGNSGSGDDSCSVHACCLIDGPCPAELGGATFDAGQCTAVSQTCIEACQPLVKPDCDCFGCCNVCPPGQSCVVAMLHPVVSPQCTLESLGDPAACRPCTRDASCKVLAIPVFENGFES